MWQLDPEGMRWREMKPGGKGPEPRRRQALCQVVSTVNKLSYDELNINLINMIIIKPNFS